jgi:hypothetical protein
VPSVSLLPDVYVALGYREGGESEGKPPRFALGRVVTGDIAEEDGSVKLDLLTANNGEDPVRSSYRRAGRVLTIVASELLLTDLRMVQGMTISFTLRLFHK